MEALDAFHLELFGWTVTPLQERAQAVTAQMDPQEAKRILSELNQMRDQEVAEKMVEWGGEGLLFEVLNARALRDRGHGERLRGRGRGERSVPRTGKRPGW